SPFLLMIFNISSLVYFTYSSFWGSTGAYLGDFSRLLKNSQSSKEISSETTEMNFDGGDLTINNSVYFPLNLETLLLPKKWCFPSFFLIVSEFPYSLIKVDS